MQLGSLKRWQWGCIGVMLGLAVSLWRGWIGPEDALIDRPTLESIEFEKLLLARTKSGQPVLKDIRVYQLDEKAGWLIAKRTFGRGNEASEYVPVKIPVKNPYVPALTRPNQTNPNYTVVDYLRSVQATHPEVRYSTGWWSREPMRTPIFALGGMILLGSICPFLMHVLGAADPSVAEKAKEKEYDLSRFGKGNSKKNAKTTAAAAAPSIQTTTAGSSDAPKDEQPKVEKRYGGEFYPTATHVKPEEK